MDVDPFHSTGMHWMDDEGVNNNNNGNSQVEGVKLVLLFVE